MQAYIAAMPGWKSAVGGRIDRLIEGVVPGVRKAVKWNSPFYGMEDDIWFLSLHCFTKYIKVTFLNGASLQPLPPGTSKHPKVRYLDIHEDAFDEAQFVEWVRQASVLPGEKCERRGFTGATGFWACDDREIGRRIMPVFLPLEDRVALRMMRNRGPSDTVFPA